ncbi:spermidine synthase [Brachybacterium subflavum]|uniref:spermidine synthase n=1 Tax=Brachybacterium subflavum TaxID=2585206 RepID=UPI0012660DE7|nr:spermidine synthase [Brachybacterium subflavum]
MTHRAPRPAARSARLSHSDLLARIRPDGYSEHGFALDVGGIEQSHVDIEDPTAIRHEYLRRIAHVVDSGAEPGAPVRVLHLGAGALTLARYVQATRPGSPQVVVEIERELPDLVISALPLPRGTDLEVRIGDAAEELAAMGSDGSVGPVGPGGSVGPDGSVGSGGSAGPDGSGDRGGFDVIVVDVFSGQSTPAHLTREGFFADALEHLSELGVMAVNVGDDAGLRFFAAQARALDAATEAAGLAGVWTLADEHVVRALDEGNLVLAAGPGLERSGGADPERLRERWRAGGPHPVVVLDPAETSRLIGRIEGG